MADRVAYRLDDGVAYVTLDDGKANIMSAAMLSDIGAALYQAERDEAIVVLRSGRSGVFSAGFDLKVFASGDAAASLAMVRAGAELALRLLSFPRPVIGVMEGHAYPMGAFLLLACDVRLGARGPHRIGLNEVAIGITPPGFAIELARSRLHPAWLSRTVTLGEMFEGDDALAAGFLDRIVAPEAVDATLAQLLVTLRGAHGPSHARAKAQLRRPVMEAMRAAIDRELTPAAYAARAASGS